MSEENDTPEEDFAAAVPEPEDENSSPKKSSGGLKFLTLLMLIAAVGLFVFPYVWGLEDRKAVSPDSSVLNDWMLWLGDLHVLVLHVPIGLFVYVLAMEFFGILSFGKFKPQLRGALFLTAISGIVAVGFGYLHFLRGDYGNAPLEFAAEGNRMGMHMWLSIMFVAFVVLAFVSKMWAHHQKKWSPFYPLFIIVAAVSMGIGAHKGGEMVHTDKDIAGDFMKLKNGEPLGVAEDEVTKLPAVTDIPANERLVYSQVVKPILYGKCWECHAPAELNPLGKKKIKGGLEMTSVAKLLEGGKGGEDFPTLIPGNSKDSEMIVRVHLDLDDDEFMPTGKEDEPEMHLTDGEKRILAWWIDSTPLIDEEGDKPLSEVAGYETILADVEAFKPAREAASEELPAEDAEKKEEEPKVSRRDQVEEAKGAIDKVMPGALTFSSKDSEDLFFTAVSQGKDFSDEGLAKLEPVSGAIVDLDVKKTAVTDEGMKSVATMINLKKLMLNETKVTDAGLKTLAVLPNLESLSLFGTDVTDEGIAELAKTATLKNVYLSNTKVTKAGVEELSKNLPEAKVEFVQPPAPKPKAEPKAEPKKEEPKKEDPKAKAATPKVLPVPGKKPAEAKGKDAPALKQAEMKKPEAAPAPKKDAPKEAAKKEGAKPAPAEKAKAQPKAEEKSKKEEVKPVPAPAKKAEAAPAPEDKKKVVEPAPTPKEKVEAKPAPEKKVEEAPAKKDAPKAKPAPAPKADEEKPEEVKEEKPKAVPAEPTPKKKEVAQPTPTPEKKETVEKVAPTPEKKEEVKKAVKAPEKKEAAPAVAPEKKEVKKAAAPAPTPEKVDAPKPPAKKEVKKVAPAEEQEKVEKADGPMTPEERAKEAIRKLREAAKG
ncbi:MAG: DUF2231 domain-containing protein [Roseibacillus sp.]